MLSLPETRPTGAVGRGFSTPQLSQKDSVHHQSERTASNNPASTLKGAKFVYINARSVKSVSNRCHKPVQLQCLFELEKPDIVAITETWLTSSIKDTEIIPSNFAVHRKDREASLPGKTGGGVLLAVRNSYASSRRSDLEPVDEILVCDVKENDAKKFAVILIYRPPDGNQP